jgi:hypothetical protein
VLALLEPHRPRLLPKLRNPLEGFSGLSQGRMLETLLRPVTPIIIDVLLPGLRDHLTDRLASYKAEPLFAPANPVPAPSALLPPAVETGEEATPGVIEVAEAMRALVRLLRGGGRPHLQAVVGAVRTEGRDDADQIVRETRSVTRGSIDGLARALLRFEVRYLLLETLGAEAAVQEIVFQRRRLARFALRQATQAIEGFVTNRGIKALHASLATLASVDGLIVIALRNLDDQQESREEASAFVEPADRKALNDYLSAAWRLSDTLFGMVARATGGGELDDLLFAALLRQLRGLHHFCADLIHEGRPATVDTLERRLVERTRVLTRLANERLVQSLLRRPCDHAASLRMLQRGQSLAQLLLDMGCAEEVEALAVQLVAARDALGQPVA